MTTAVVQGQSAVAMGTDRGERIQGVFWWWDKRTLLIDGIFFWNLCEIVKVKVLSRVRLFATPCTVAHQAPLSMAFPRQEYWNRLPFPTPKTYDCPINMNAWDMCLERRAAYTTSLGLRKQEFFSGSLRNQRHNGYKARRVGI